MSLIFIQETIWSLLYRHFKIWVFHQKFNEFLKFHISYYFSLYLIFQVHSMGGKIEIIDNKVGERLRWKNCQIIIIYVISTKSLYNLTQLCIILLTNNFISDFKSYKSRYMYFFSTKYMRFYSDIMYLE